MKMVKTTHRTNGKARPLPTSYNCPKTSKKRVPEHQTHSKASKK